MTEVSQRLKLRVLWLKNELGVAIDQTTTRQSYPITKYYFWPRTEAWDQLKLELDSKSWLSAREKINVLNLATDIITHWRRYRKTAAINDLVDLFSEATFVELNSEGL
jgi:30S ribosomal protein 3|tara:strand:+ start:1022 stop:1345 length:324 start_codon:yes stop_codon:yes gene_type:complete